MLSNSPIPRPQLTPSELTMLRLLASGYTQKQAARELGVSPRTVEAHRCSARKKFGAKTTPHMIGLAVAAGLVWPVQLPLSEEQL